MMFNFKISSHRPSGIQPSAIGLWSAWPGLALALALIMASPQVRAQTPAPASAQAAASADEEAVAVAPSPADPWEPFNRKVFAFNEGLDRAILKPVATTYQRHTPNVVQSGVGNFMSNLRDVWSTVNLFLQFKPRAGLEMSARVLINSTLGIYGLIDWATPAGLDRRTEDFGQTLGRWGMGSGPYLVLPLLGPSTLRDASAYLVGDRHGDLLGELTPVSHRNVGVGLRVIDQRARLLSAGNTVDAIALDRYGFVREAYLQRRRFQVHDGNPPPDDDHNKE